MRILIAHSFYRIPGGEDRYVESLAELLGAEHEVALLAKRSTELVASASSATRMAYSTELRREVESELARFRPDVVHVHNVYPGWGPAVHLAAVSVGVPLAMTVHNHRLRCPNGLMFTEGAPCTRCERGNYANATLHECFPTRSQRLAYAGALWTHRFVLRIERHVRLFIAPSGYMSDRLRDWGIEAGRIATIRHFVRTVASEPGLIGRYGLFLGRLSPEKGFDLLLEALRIAGDPPFVIAGEGPLRAELEARAAGLGLKALSFVGRREGAELEELVRGARFVCLPSIAPESSGLAGLEAMAAGRPLLVTTVGALPELVTAGGGLASDPEPEALGAALRRLGTDDELCALAGAAGLELARRELTPERHRARLTEAFEGLTPGRGQSKLE